VSTTTTQLTTHTLDVPGATLSYDIRRPDISTGDIGTGDIGTGDTSTEPILLLIGFPMGATGFGTLATHFADRTVVTYDPRGTERSVETAPTGRTPDGHADDLHRMF